MSSNAFSPSPSTPNPAPNPFGTVRSPESSKSPHPSLHSRLADVNFQPSYVNSPPPSGSRVPLSALALSPSAVSTEPEESPDYRTAHSTSSADSASVSSSMSGYPLSPAVLQPQTSTSPVLHRRSLVKPSARDQARGREREQERDRNFDDDGELSLSDSTSLPLMPGVFPGSMGPRSPAVESALPASLTPANAMTRPSSLSAARAKNAIPASSLARKISNTDQSSPLMTGLSGPSSSPPDSSRLNSTTPSQSSKSSSSALHSTASPSTKPTPKSGSSKSSSSSSALKSPPPAAAAGKSPSRPLSASKNANSVKSPNPNPTSSSKEVFAKPANKAPKSSGAPDLHRKNSNSQTRRGGPAERTSRPASAQNSAPPSNPESPIRSDSPVCTPFSPPQLNLDDSQPSMPAFRKPKIQMDNEDDEDDTGNIITSSGMGGRSVASPKNINKFGLKLTNFMSNEDEDGDNGGDYGEISASESGNGKRGKLGLGMALSSGDDDNNGEEDGGIVMLGDGNVEMDAERERNISKRVPKRLDGDLRRQSFDISANGTFMAGSFEISETAIKAVPGRSKRGDSEDSNPIGIPTLMQYHQQKGNSALGMELHLEDLVRIGELGRGVNGSVVKAIHLPTLTLMALKTVNVFDKDERHQMIKELHLFNSATSPHIVQLIGACFSEGKITMALEVMNRGSLDHALKRLGKLPEPCLKNVSKQSLLGLHHLHTNHQVHRDIKPANILIANTGCLKISDFGLLKQLDNTQAMCSTFVGTMLFLSPERITGEQFSYPSDIWSLGISLIQLATGKLDLPKDYWGLLQVVNQDPPKLRPEDGVSAEMCDFVDKCLYKDPQERWSAAQLLQHPWIKGFNIDFKAQTHESWPFAVSQPPDEEELDILVDAVISRWYPRPEDFKQTVIDQARFQHIATQLGCHLKPVAEAFLKKLSPNSPASAYITDSISLTSSLRRAITTMAEEEAMKDRPSMGLKKTRDLAARQKSQIGVSAAPLHLMQRSAANSANNSVSLSRSGSLAGALAEMKLTNGGAGTGGGFQSVPVQDPFANVKKRAPREEKSDLNRNPSLSTLLVQLQRDEDD